MLTRRGFAGLVAAGLSEAAFAQRAAITAPPPGTVWLNANEFPEGPPQASIEAMTRVLGESNRYHYNEFGSFYSTLAASEKLESKQILVGAGSTEVLHCAIDAFTSSNLPLIAASPTYEAPPELAEAAGRKVVKIPLTSTYAADVKRMAAEAAKAGGGLIYLCNPNNPTASITTKQDVRWLVDNLPPETYLLVDEAYIHFATSPDVESALPYVRDGKNVIVARTFSKIFGMAGLRAGFVAARPDLIAKMAPFRNNVISIVTVRAVLAALDLGPKLIEERRAKIVSARSSVCAWCREKKLNFIDPHANFMMIETGRNIKELIPALVAKGVAPGRPFPPYDKMVRITIGTDTEMAKFKKALGEVLSV